MTLQQLNWYADGAKVRDASIKFGLRRIWQTLYNANVAKKHHIRNNQLVEYWPLYTDKLLTKAEKEEEEDDLRQQYYLLSEQLRLKDNVITNSGAEHRVNGGSSQSDSGPS